MDADVDRIIGLYSGRWEKLSSELLDVLRMSDVVKILDEIGPPDLVRCATVLRVCQKLGKPTRRSPG